MNDPRLRRTPDQAKLPVYVTRAGKHFFVVDLDGYTIAGPFKTEAEADEAEEGIVEWRMS